MLLAGERLCHYFVHLHYVPSKQGLLPHLLLYNANTLESMFCFSVLSPQLLDCGMVARQWQIMSITYFVSLLQGRTDSTHNRVTDIKSLQTRATRRISPIMPLDILLQENTVDSHHCYYYTNWAERKVPKKVKAYVNEFSSYHKKHVSCVLVKYRPLEKVSVFKMNE